MANKSEKAAESAAAQAQASMDTETEKGLRGVEVDPTPNENYTVAGVTSGKPTPEGTRGPNDPVNVPVKE